MGYPDEDDNRSIRSNRSIRYCAFPLILPHFKGNKIVFSCDTVPLNLKIYLCFSGPTELRRASHSAETAASRSDYQSNEERKSTKTALPAIYFNLTKKPVFMLFPPFISNWRRNQFSHAFPAIFLIDGEKTTYGQVGHWKIVLLFRRIWNSYHANNQNYVFLRILLTLFVFKYIWRIIY